MKFSDLESIRPITLDDDELGVILRPIKGQGGFQSLLKALRSRLHGRDLYLTPVLARRIVRYATKYGDGGFERRLRRIIDAAMRTMDN